MMYRPYSWWASYLHEVVERDAMLLSRGALAEEKLLHQLSGGCCSGVKPGHHDKLPKLVRQKAMLKPITG